MARRKTKLSYKKGGRDKFNRTRRKANQECQQPSSTNVSDSDSSTGTRADVSADKQNVEVDQSLELPGSSKQSCANLGRSFEDELMHQGPSSLSQPTYTDAGCQATVEMVDKETNTDVAVVLEVAGVVGGRSDGGSPDLSPLPSIESTLRNEVVRMEVSENWIESRGDDFINLSMMSGTANPTVTRNISLSRLGIQVFVHGQAIKNNHPVWDVLSDTDLETRKGVCLTKLAAAVENMRVCEGVRDEKCKELWSHELYLKRGFVEKGYFLKPVYRSSACHLLLGASPGETCCLACRSEHVHMNRLSKRRKKSLTVDKEVSKTNIRYLSNYDLTRALREARLLNSKYKKQIKWLKQKADVMISKEGHKLSKSWSDDFVNVNKANFDKMTPVQKLFWDQQLKAASLKNKKSMKWHPMMIKLALHFSMISSSAYENVRDSGFITLPSKRTLFDYSHAIDAAEGCQEAVIRNFRDELHKKCPSVHEQYCCLIADEMHIRSNLVYQKNTGKLVGYAHLTEIESEFHNLLSEWNGSSSDSASTPPAPPSAKKVLVFMAKTIAPDNSAHSVKDIIAVYSVSNLNAVGMYQRTWEVIYNLESCGIPVLVFTCDGSSVNRLFIEMHSNYFDSDVLHATLNIASRVMRPLFFIIDPVHLIKTLRNCFANSYCHRKTRKLWREGESISWELIVRQYEDHKHEKFRKSLISAAHVYLNSFSVMKVKFASQVFSKRVANAIAQDAEQAAHEGKPFPPYKQTVKFIHLVNDLFDCMNGHNVTSHIRYRNENLAPYTDVNDKRFDFLLEVLQYFESWEKSVNSRAGPFNKKERKRMLISDQTVSGIRITVRSFIGFVKFLLGKGAKAICGRSVCQDPLEQAFSIFRLKGGCSNNPDLATVLQSRISMHVQRQVARPSKRGNTAAEGEEVSIDNTPLPKRCKK